MKTSLKPPRTSFPRTVRRQHSLKRQLRDLQPVPTPTQRDPRGETVFGKSIFSCNCLYLYLMHPTCRESSHIYMLRYDHSNDCRLFYTGHATSQVRYPKQGGHKRPSTPTHLAPGEFHRSLCTSIQSELRITHKSQHSSHKYDSVKSARICGGKSYSRTFDLGVDDREIATRHALINE